MNLKANKKLTGISQRLRRNMTKEENKLWYDFLRNLSIPFKRQKIIGRYIVDFYCASKNLVIEIDGSQHYWGKGEAKDCARDAYLKQMGLTVLRYSNSDINLNFKNVCEDIYCKLGL